MANTQTQTDPNVPQGLDPTAFYLTKAIKQTETGGSQNAYTAPGKSGEYGAYQYTPDTWNADSQKYLGQTIPLNQATPEQQNQVAYSKVKDLLDENNGSQTAVASIWNSGHADPNVIGTGKNKYGVQYDVPGYVNKVKQAYLGYSNGNSGSADNTQPNSKGFITKANLPSVTTNPSDLNQNNGFLGTNPNDDLYGKVLNNSITRGIEDFGNLLTGGGTGQLGNQIGLAASNLYGMTKGITPTEQPSLSETVKGAAKVIGSAGLLAGGAELASPKYAINSPIIGYNIPMDTAEFAKLSNANKLDTLVTALKDASPSDKLVIQKAINEVTPLAEKELGLTPGLLSKVLSQGGKVLKTLLKSSGAAGIGYALGNGAVGNTVKGIYHGVVGH